MIIDKQSDIVKYQVAFGTENLTIEDKNLEHASASITKWRPSLFLIEQSSKLHFQLLKWYLYFIELDSDCICSDIAAIDPITLLTKVGGIIDFDEDCPDSRSESWLVQYLIMKSSAFRVCH